MVIMFVAAISKEGLVLGRFWAAPVLGVFLGLIIYTIKWLAPLQIDSGPKGIVLDKGGNLTLIPWENISNFQIEVTESVRKLHLYIGGVKDMRGLFLPSNINLEALQNELRENTSP
jgi:hypothetical protein